jgi:tetratricopeptide (TPR) repeat protein
MENQAEHNQKKRRPLFWFVVGWIFLLLMALTWSLDAIPSIFLAIAGIFFFTGYWMSPRLQVDRPSHHERWQTKQATESVRSAHKKQSTESSTVPMSHASNTRKIAWIASAFIAFVFVSIALPIIFSSGDSSAEDDAAVGLQYYEAQMYDSARALYWRALRKDPENVAAIIGYGNTIWYFNNTDSALVMFEKALSIDPENDYAQYRKAAVYSETGRHEQAIIELKKLLDQNPEYYDAMQLTGDVYYNQKSYDEALRWYEKAYANGVRNRWICHLMAYLYDRKNETPKALPLYREALQYDSTNTEVYVRLGELLPGPDGEFFRSRGAALSQP